MVFVSFYPIRKADVGLILTVVTLAGIIWAGYAKPASWDHAVKEVAEIKPKVAEHSTQLAVITSALIEMQEDLKYLRRHAR